jgi:hypothetical protein
MHHSRRRLQLGILTTLAFMLVACGSSSGSDPTSSSEQLVAVSATSGTHTPVPEAAIASSSAKAAVGTKLEPVIRPGADAPLDSAPDRVSKQVGRRVFATGFEEGVELTRDVAERGRYQYFTGADAEGFAFPVPLGDAASAWSSRVNAEVGRASSMAPEHFAFASIKTVAGHDGKPTRALSLISRSKSHATDAQQISLENAGLPGAQPIFQRMWLKFDPDTLERARQHGHDRFYQTFWEVKGQGDFWLRLKLHFEPGHGLTWVAKANGMDSHESYWKESMKLVSVALAGADQAAGWHLVDIWLDPSTARFKVSIDGEALVDRLGGFDSSDIRDYRMAMVGSTVAPIAEILVDKLEFWDLPPTDAFQAPAPSRLSN